MTENTTEKKKSLKIISGNTADSSCNTDKSADIAGAHCGSSHQVHRKPGLTHSGEFRGTAALVTLGCAKNQVDSEVMLGVLAKRGFETVSELNNADVIVVNTCGFLESSSRESINTILECADYKKKGRLKRLIVAGCLVERHKEDLKASMPEVDAFITTSELLNVGDVAVGDSNDLLENAGRAYFLYDDQMPRKLSTPSHFAYIKISEGCNRPCTYCIIPKIRGVMRSRTVDSVIAEARSLADQGVKELNLVAQDLTSYGTDIKGPKLSHLLRELNKVDGISWIRLLYAYPIGVDEELIDTIMESEKIVKYLDIPLQHVSDAVLQSMKRPLGRLAPRPITEFIKGRAPDLTIRTTFIVGFPGETDQHAEELKSFVSEGHFGSVGVFTYSPEQGTPSYEYPDQVSEKDKKKRRDMVMKAQSKVVDKALQGFIGKTIPVLVEGPHEESDLLWSARATFQAPEVDGSVIINDVAENIALESLNSLKGNFYNVRVTEISGYDLVGELVS